MLHSTGELVVFNRAFYILKRVIELRNFGVFSAAFIKKWYYWPRYVPDQEIDNYMYTKDIGDVASL